MGVFLFVFEIFISMKSNKKIRLKELLLKVCEGKCERLPNETDEEFISRCGNDMFNQNYFDVYKQKVGTFKNRNIMK